MDETTDGLTVGQVAEAAGVTVRTLHHYDRLGLLKPKNRTDAGYRTYGEVDLQRLSRILLYKELGFSLEKIASLLEGGDDVAAHLESQRSEVSRRIERLEAMLQAIDREMEADSMGRNLSPEERFEFSGDLDPKELEAEAEERWGGTDAYKESQRRAAEYDKEQWAAIKKESDAINTALVGALQSGEDPTGERAMSLAEEHRLHLGRWFYTCDHEMHRALGEMYVADERFTQTYERIAPGLARFFRDAICANSERVSP